MEKNSLDPIIQELSAALRKKFGNHIMDIIIFGSRARGDYQEDSDYDVIALVDVKTRELRDKIYEVTGDLGFAHNVTISIFVYEKERFEKDKYEPLFMNVRREGIYV